MPAGGRGAARLPLRESVGVGASDGERTDAGRAASRQFSPRFGVRRRDCSPKRFLGGFSKWNAGGQHLVLDARLS